MFVLSVAMKIRQTIAACVKRNSALLELPSASFWLTD